MNISNQYAITIFRKDFDDRAAYTTTLTKTKADKTKEFGYIKCEFRKDVEKFGFHKTNYDGEEGYLKRSHIFCGNNEIFIRKNKTFLIINDTYYVIGGEGQKEYIQDLIDAGLVEEVSNE